MVLLAVCVCVCMCVCEPCSLMAQRIACLGQVVIEATPRTTRIMLFCPHSVLTLWCRSNAGRIPRNFPRRTHPCLPWTHPCLPLDPPILPLDPPILPLDPPILLPDSPDPGPTIPPGPTYPQPPGLPRRSHAPLALSPARCCSSEGRSSQTRSRCGSRTPSCGCCCTSTSTRR